jgi:hypothetical protein
MCFSYKKQKKNIPSCTRADNVFGIGVVQYFSTQALRRDYLNNRKKIYETRHSPSKKKTKKTHWPFWKPRIRNRWKNTNIEFTEIRVPLNYLFIALTTSPLAARNYYYYDTSRVIHRCPLISKSHYTHIIHYIIICYIKYNL